MKDQKDTISFAELDSLMGNKPKNPFSVASAESLETKLSLMGMGELRAYAISCGVRATGGGATIKERIRKEFDKYQEMKGGKNNKMRSPVTYQTVEQARKIERILNGEDVE